MNNLLSDEVIIELFHLKMRLYVIYYSQDKILGTDEIIKYQTSILDWVIKLVIWIVHLYHDWLYYIINYYFRNLLVHDLHHKNECTITFLTKIVNIVNDIVLNMCLISFVNNTFLEYYCTFCISLLHSKEIYKYIFFLQIFIFIL